MPFTKTIINSMKHWVDKRIEESKPKIIQSDLTVNNPDDPAYVKGRTHWREVEYGEVVPETTLEMNDTYVENPFSMILVKGETYKVVWDGVEYECLARDDGYSGVYIGNQQVVEWDFPEIIVSDEPFYISYFPSDSYVECNVMTPGIYTISITGATSEIVYPIDSKYLPDELLAMLDSETLYLETTISFDDLEEFVYNDLERRNHFQWGSWIITSNINIVGIGDINKVIFERIVIVGTDTMTFGDPVIIKKNYYVDAVDGVVDLRNAVGAYNAVTTPLRIESFNASLNSYTHFAVGTVDESGNAWFQGTIKVGGTGQDDEAAQEVALKSDVTTMIQEALSEFTNVAEVGA